MNTFSHAPIVTQITPPNTDAVDVFGGSPLRVLGFIISAIVVGPTTATIRTNEASPVILFMGPVIQASKIYVPIPIIADKGLEVVASAGDSLSFTFFHAQLGS
jgi:hypothetical protein